VAGSALPALTLLVPGLVPDGLRGGAGPCPAPGRPWLEGLELGVLERWLGRGLPGPPPVAEGGLEALLGRLLGYPGGHPGPPALAVLLRAAEGLPRDGRWWLRAEPVHLKAEGPRLVVDERLPALGPAEREALAGALAPLLEEAGLRLEPSPAGTWYLAAPEDPGLEATPPGELLGRELDPARLPPGRRWRRLLTELQMLLHEHPVNRERRARGLPPANALWLWGAGREPPPPPAEAPFRALWGGGEAARALAAWAGVPARPLPEGAVAWLEAREAAGPSPGLPRRPGGGGEELAVVEALSLPAALGRVEAWREALGALLETWLAPLDRLLRAGALARLRLAHERGVLELDRRALRRWWRRRPFPGPWGAGC